MTREESITFKCDEPDCDIKLTTVPIRSDTNLDAYLDLFHAGWDAYRPSANTKVKHICRRHAKARNDSQ